VDPRFDVTAWNQDADPFGCLACWLSLFLEGVIHFGLALRNRCVICIQDRDNTCFQMPFRAHGSYFFHMFHTYKVLGVATPPRGALAEALV